MSAAPAVSVRFWAAAREAAGRPSQEVQAASCSELVAALSVGNDRLAKVLAMSSLLVDGTRRAATDDTTLPAGSVVEVLPPFAGG